MTQTMDAPANVPVRQNGSALPTQRNFDPLAPVGSQAGLKGLIETQRAALASMLPRHITPERLFKTLLVAANRNPDIIKCTQSSILETINRAAELGLDLSGTLGEAYPVPFNNKVKDSRGNDVWVSQLQLIIGYRGMEKLAWQSGEIQSIDAEVVYEKDRFLFRKGSVVLVEWEPYLKSDRGEAVGAYACVAMKSGGTLARFLTKDDIEKIRSSSKSGNSPAWRNWWSEMARKCALKRTLKDAPLSTEKMTKAMEIDSEDHLNLSDVLEAENKPRGSRTTALAARITGRPVSEGQSFTPDADAAEQVAAQDAACGETIDQDTGEVTSTQAGEPETKSGDQKTAAALPSASIAVAAFLSHSAWVDAINGAASAENREEHEIWDVLSKIKNLEKLSSARRRELYDQFVSRTGAFAG